MFPVVLYNGLKRWNVPNDIRQMIKPQLPDFLSVFQPSLRYYLIDEGAYTDEQLNATPNAVSGVFAVEKASGNYQQMQRAVDRIVEIIKSDPNKERIDKVVTRWLKRHLHYLGDSQNWDRIHSLIEDHAMIAENLRTWKEQAHAEGVERGMHQEKLATAKNLLALNMMSDAQIAQVTGLDESIITELRQSMIQH